MNPVTLDDLLKIVPNKFLLTMIVAARAKQLEQGAERKVTTPLLNSLDIAMIEIAEGKIDCEALIRESEQKVQEQRMIEEEETSETASEETTVEGLG